MWKIWHRVFGAHYIALRYGHGDHVRRVCFDLTGRPYVKMYGEFIWLLNSKERWQALTFDKEAWVKTAAPPNLRVVA